MKIELIDIGSSIDDMNSFLLGIDTTLIYQSENYLRHLEHHLDCKCKYLLAKGDNGEIIGALPFAVSNGNSGTVINSLPFFGSNGGLIIKDQKPEVAENLVKALVEVFENSPNPLSLTLIENPLNPANVDFDGLGLSGKKDSRIGQITVIKGMQSPEHLMQSFGDPRPRNIRAAIKKGVTIRRSNELADLVFLHKVHVENISAIGGKVKDLEFFTSIPDFFNSNEWAIYIAEIEEVPVAGLLIFRFNNTIEYFTPATLSEYRNTQALALVIFTAMCDALSDGMHFWNWGGTWHSQEGVYDYKKRWNTQDLNYEYHTLISPKVLEQDLAVLQSEHKGFYLFPF